ncbi:hypothetical protein CDL15_Pgr018786 [Punica granatum]|uniref:Uncharacterized protein n=1 Tax=Punica granatum TaxID=22663 RepID=A0A218VUP0_PUNGR|nr:hypothetical protein CDL15_Pgr018786 [Punica granatum]PKI39952.1 hypothetical protein CRG98_039615 [Punica granatum]
MSRSNSPQQQRVGRLSNSVSGEGIWAARSRLMGLRKRDHSLRELGKGRNHTQHTGQVRWWFRWTEWRYVSECRLLMWPRAGRGGESKGEAVIDEKERVGFRGGKQEQSREGAGLVRCCSVREKKGETVNVEGVS